jgi:hypothetical protein
MKGGDVMPTYDLSVHCKDCGRDHPVLLRLHIERGPDRKQSIAELFHGGSVPPQVAAIRGHMAFCHKTGRKFPLENDSDIFLSPPAYFKQDSVID